MTSNPTPGFEKVPDMPWIGDDYQPGRSAMIVLHCAYYATTKACMDAFISGEHDTSFNILFD